jgi:hypothetical protein
MPRPRNAVCVMIMLPGARRQVATAPVGIASKTAASLVVAHVRRRHPWSIKLFELSCISADRKGWWRCSASRRSMRLKLL